MHSAGWLESGLVSCFEKFIVDIEILRMLLEAFRPVEISEESLAFSPTRRSVTVVISSAPDIPWSGSARAFYRPLLSSAQNHERWMRDGAQDAAARASKIYREKLAAHEPPALDGGIRAELAS
jgi:trimethylamine---corrinoid protein Co-methyltransferase